MKKAITTIGVIVFVITFAGTVIAAGQANTRIQNKKQIQVIKKASGLSTKVIKALMRQHYGNGKIVIAGAIAKASNQTADRIIALKRQGMLWGEIAQKYNVRFGNVIRSVYIAIHNFEKQAKQSKDKNGISAADSVRHDIQQQQKTEVRERMQQRNKEIRNEKHI